VTAAIAAGGTPALSRLVEQNTAELLEEVRVFVFLLG
jgi:hypothetical protein